MERRHRSIIAAMWLQQRQAGRAAQTASGGRWSLFVSFRNGMQTLVDRLAQRLPEGAIRLRTPVTALERVARGWRLNGTDLCDAVIVATPAPQTASLLQPVAPALAQELAAIAYASTVTVNVAYRREDIPHPLDGFGFVVPYSEGRKILACTISSLKYAGRAPAELVLLRAFVGGALQPELCGLDDHALEHIVASELRVLLGVVAEPVLTRIARYPQAMPQYHVGHLDRLVRIDQHVAQLPGLALAGNAYRGVGIPDCIHSGESAAVAVCDGVQREATWQTR
jgi:oxygen-dependent protoporphyrinogen oxidase